MKSFKQLIHENDLAATLSTDVRSAVKRGGGKIYQIGGAVRDEILGKISKDLDLLVVGIELEALGKILEPFGKVNLVGKSFGIIKYTPEGGSGEIDISIPRIDSKSTGKGHKDFEVKLGKGITLQQDQLRRDFWINALAKDLDTGKVIDIGRKGMTDLKKKEIRMISPVAFEEDPLRMLRAVQFAARFEFKIESKTFEEIKKNAKSISTVSAERFQEEFRKMFTKAEKPSIGIKLLFDTGLIDHILPQSNLRKIDLASIDKLDKKAFPAFMGMLMNGYGSNAGKEVISKMRLSNNDADAVQSVVTYTDNSPFLEKNDFKLVQFIKNVDNKGIANIDEYLKVKNRPTLSSRLRRMTVTSIKDLSIGGRDLMGIGLKGIQVGDALNHALEFAVKTGKNNKLELLRAIKNKYNIREEVKVESVLKYMLSSKDMGALSKMRDSVVTKNSDMKPIKDLHITLASGPEWKKLRKRLFHNSLPDPNFKLEFEKPKKVKFGGRVSWYTKVKQQKQLKDYVTDLIQANPDPKRIFHVSLANKTGNSGDSVANI